MGILKPRILALTCILGFAPAILAQAQTDPATLFRQLRLAETTDKATEALLKGATGDVQVREFLKNNLPPMIDSGYKSLYPQWVNAVRLAGELKMVEAAPALARWIGLDEFGETTNGQFQRLETDPAAKALYQIGDPAIPSLVGVLGHGTAQQRKIAYLTLNLIGSSLAKAAIRDRNGQETDPGLRKLIEKLAPQ